MPKFAANLSTMFNEVPFPQRFAAAARAGFRAVEFLFPYEHGAAEVAGWLRENRLENVLFNLPPGDWASGERGLAALPGREADFRASVDRALDYALALGTRRLHAMAGVLVVEAQRDYRAACRETYFDNLRYAARELALRRDRPRAGRQRPVPPRTGRRRGQLSLSLQAARRAWLRRLGGLRVPPARQDRGWSGMVAGGDPVTTRRTVQRVVTGGDDCGAHAA